MPHTPANTTEHPTTLAPTRLDAALAHAAELAAESIAPSTRRAYAADWRAFVAWTERQGSSVSPALPVSVSTCAAYLADMEREGRAVATINRRVRGLAFVHREFGLESPTSDTRIRRLLAGDGLSFVDVNTDGCTGCDTRTSRASRRRAGPSVRSKNSRATNRSP